jgi:D-psicose/D-tagatose/L-ribulose 3-epimerase
MKRVPEIALCNEMLAAEGFSFDDQCRIAAELGYDGVEIAPGTLGDAPHLLDTAERRRLREVARSHGLAISGLHWLLAAYPGLSITQAELADETAGVLEGLIDLCADLGGGYLVHGSPAQRRVAPDQIGQATEIATGVFARLARRAADRGVVYCIEPLSRNETRFINTIAEGAELVRRVDNPAFRTMIDCSAAGLTEDVPVAGVIREWVPTGIVGHIHLNDTNRSAPGTGSDPFREIVNALHGVGWDGWLGMEPFKTRVNAVVTAAIGISTVKAHWEGVTA